MITTRSLHQNLQKHMTGNSNLKILQQFGKFNNLIPTNSFVQIMEVAFQYPLIVPKRNNLAPDM